MSNSSSMKTGYTPMLGVFQMLGSRLSPTRHVAETLFDVVGGLGVRFYFTGGGYCTVDNTGGGGVDPEARDDLVDFVSRYGMPVGARQLEAAEVGSAPVADAWDDEALFGLRTDVEYEERLSSSGDHLLP